ncbi:MAG: hypothetical protein WBV94_21185 [Blastocatellia bacterium]
MSTITVVKKNGYAAIASDTLTKWDYIKESAEYIANHEKIIRVGESYIGIAGSMTFGQSVRDYLSRPDIEIDLNSKEAIFATWTSLHRVLKEDYYLNPDEDEQSSFESTRAETLVANKYGIFGISAYRSVQEFTKFYACGGGCEFALGAMYAIYKEERYTAEEIARIGVEGSAEFDDSTGLPVVSYSLKLR